MFLQFKEQVTSILDNAIRSAGFEVGDIVLEPSPHADIASRVAFGLASKAKRNPKDIAEIKRLFPTPSKKIECYLTNLESKGVDPMPTWKEEYNFTVPDGKFRLITGRHAQYTQSGTSNNVVLRDLMPENYIWINKRVAKEKGIAFGDTLEVKSRTGSTTIKAYPTEKMAPNQVFFIHGFGEESSALTWAYKNGGNDNAVIEDVLEPVYGAAAMHETNVEIRKV